MTPKKISKLLVANRGEIALRIIYTARQLNIPTLALVTEVEKNTLYGQIADETIIIGDGPSQNSFLDIDKIINLAIQKNVDAIHPGYGFLSENVNFVKEIENNNMIFVGPNSQTMAKMGAKDVSKNIMIDNNIPVTPGYNGENQNPKILQEEAEKIGYPVILKAVLGGGGKGMRIVRKNKEFQEMLQSCKAECRNAFNDDRIIIEKYIEDPKHIEVQILADNYGNTFHFFERDCSIQRRHQKIIEEAPSNLPIEIIQQIRQTAVLAAQGVNYNNAGTIEFLVNKQNYDFYFMEMNTRLQVEHPISEMITGQNLMELQLRVAQGENLKNLKLPQKPLGHSIEARICSEDCFNNFLPSTGKVYYFGFNNKQINDWNHRFCQKIPDDVQQERLDSNLLSGDNITQYYDSMIGKLIVYGNDRQDALQKLYQKLIQIKILGVQTNVPFILNLFSDKDFLNYNYSLKYFEQKSEELLKEKDSFDFVSFCGFVLMKCFNGIQEIQTFRNNTKLQKVFRIVTKRSFTNQISQKYIVFVEQQIKNQAVFNIRIQQEDKIVEENQVEILKILNNKISLKINNEIFQRDLFEQYNQYYYHNNGAFYDIEDHTYISIKEDEEQLLQNKIYSPMPGTVTKINFKEGDIVEEGEVLLCIEAMKMETKIIAQNKLKIEKIYCEQQTFYDMNSLLLEVEYIQFIYQKIFIFFLQLQKWSFQI